MNHQDVGAREENIKGRHNWLNEKRARSVPDRNGHGTFTACLLLDYAPDVELYVAKIADSDPTGPSVIAKVSFTTVGVSDRMSNPAKCVTGNRPRGF